MIDLFQSKTNIFRKVDIHTSYTSRLKDVVRFECVHIGNMHFSYKKGVIGFL
jgi:hypothetical protein